MVTVKQWSIDKWNEFKIDIHIIQSLRANEKASFSGDSVSIEDWHDFEFDILNQGHHHMHRI